MAGLLIKSIVEQNTLCKYGTIVNKADMCSKEITALETKSNRRQAMKGAPENCFV